MKRQGQISVNSKNMFPIIKKWLYSDKDIFLREIVSNGCDAIKKLESLRGIGQAPDEEGYQPKVIVTIDPDKKQLIVSDNGIGMTEDEVERYITQIAFSGAEEFLEKYKEKSEGDAGIIGHFGLGFYSAFMVSGTVEIQTLSYQEGAKPVHWISSGEEEYEIEDGDRTEHGTTIIMNIAEDEQEFLQEARIHEILHKYCQFMPYEIYLNPHDEERTVYDEEGNPEKNEDGTEKKEIVKPRPVNDTHPLWLKAPKDCTDEEYKEFYHKVFMDFNEPLFWIHLNVDYPFNLKGILYFPKQQNKLEIIPGQVKLYSNQVFVADNIKEVIPEFLLLLKGVIDCPDMPLNVSRSFLQNDRQVQKISEHITKKVADKLTALFKNDRTKYEECWADIANFIKFGCIKDGKFYDRVKDIIIYKDLDGKYRSLEEFLGKEKSAPADGEDKGDEEKKEDGKDEKPAPETIYYVSDELRQAQYIKMFRDAGLNAMVCDNSYIDPHFITFLEYKAPDKLKFARIDAAVDGALKEGEGEDDSVIRDIFKEAVGDDKLTIKTERLKNAAVPAVINVDEIMRRYSATLRTRS